LTGESEQSHTAAEHISTGEKVRTISSPVN